MPFFFSFSRQLIGCHFHLIRSDDVDDDGTDSIFIQDKYILVSGTVAVDRIEIFEVINSRLLFLLSLK